VVLVTKCIQNRNEERSITLAIHIVQRKYRQRLKKDRKWRKKCGSVTGNRPWQKAFRGHKKCFHSLFLITSDCGDPGNFCRNFVYEMGQKEIGFVNKGRRDERVEVLRI
jgi:hypothetical protein